MVSINNVAHQLRCATSGIMITMSLSDGIDEGVDGEQGTTNDDADETSHDNHENWLDHGGDIINLLVELVFVDGGGFAEHFIDFTGFFADGSHLRN